MERDMESTSDNENRVSLVRPPLILIVALVSVILIIMLIFNPLQQPNRWIFPDNQSDNASLDTNTHDKTSSPSSSYQSIWNYSFGKERVTAVALSNDGRYVAAGAGSVLSFFSNNGTLLWNSATSDESKNIKGTFRALAINDDGSYSIGSLDNTFYYFARNGTLLWKENWGFGADSIRNIAASSNGHFLVIGTVHNHVRYYNSESPRPIWIFTTFLREKTSESGAGSHVTMSADGQYIAASGEDSRVYYFNQSGALIWRSNKTGRPLESIAMSADGQTIAAGSRDQNVYVFDNAGNLLWNSTTGDVVRTVAMSSDRNYIVAGSDDAVISFFNHNGTLLATYRTGKPLTSLAISRTGNTIAAGSKDFGIYCFDQEGKILWSYRTTNTVNSVAVSEDGQYIVAGSYDGNVYFFNRNGIIDGP
jgi:WD40 repeat protein